MKNPFHSDARVRLAWQRAKGGDESTEATLLEGARHDRQFAPAWALANFYFRAGKAARFWYWARAAAQVSPGGLTALFDLCFAQTSDAAVVADRVITGRTLVEREFVAYLLAQDRLEDAQVAARRLAPHAGIEDRAGLLDYVERTLDLAVWDQLCVKRLIPYAPLVPGALVNGGFHSPILNRGFDWHFPSPDSIAATQTEDGVLELFLPAHRADSCELLYQHLRLDSGERYTLRFAYRTNGLTDPTGLRWSLGGGLVCEIPASENWTQGAWRWQAQRDTGRLVIHWRRPPGTVKHEGFVRLRKVGLESDRRPLQ